VRVLCIGCGSAGRRHIGNLIALGCEVFVFDMSPAAQEAAFAMGAHPKSIMGRPPDAVVIATPWDQHARSVEWALESYQWRPLFIEKPIGTVNQTIRWAELAADFQARNIPTQIGYQLRFHPAAQALTSIAKPVLGRFTCDADMASWPGSNYGPMLLELSHEVDLALHCGAPSQRIVVDILRETRAVFSLCGADGRRWRIALDGQAGRYHRSWCVGNAGANIVAEFTQPDALGVDMYKAEMAHFLNAVRTGKQSWPAATLADGVKVLEICHRVMVARRIDEPFDQVASVLAGFSG